jgi:hypothetical protein
MHMWHHVTNHLIISNDKDSNSENRIKLRVRDKQVEEPLVEVVHQEEVRQHVTITCRKTLDSAVMTMRAEKYH